MTFDVLDIDVALGEQDLAQAIVAVNPDLRRQRADLRRRLQRREEVLPGGEQRSGVARRHQATPSAATRCPASLRDWPACGRRGHARRRPPRQRPHRSTGSGANRGSSDAIDSARCISAVRRPSVAATSRYVARTSATGAGGARCPEHSPAAPRLAGCGRAPDRTTAPSHSMACVQPSVCPSMDCCGRVNIATELWTPPVVT